MVSDSREFLDPITRSAVSAALRVADGFVLAGQPALEMSISGDAGQDTPDISTFTQGYVQLVTINGQAVPQDDSAPVSTGALECYSESFNVLRSGIYLLSGSIQLYGVGSRKIQYALPTQPPVDIGDVSSPIQLAPRPVFLSRTDQLGYCQILEDGNPGVSGSGITLGTLTLFLRSFALTREGS